MARGWSLGRFFSGFEGCKLSTRTCNGGVLRQKYTSFWAESNSDKRQGSLSQNRPELNTCVCVFFNDKFVVDTSIPEPRGIVFIGQQKVHFSPMNQLFLGALPRSEDGANPTVGVAVVGLTNNVPLCQKKVYPSVRLSSSSDACYNRGIPFLGENGL